MRGFIHPFCQHIGLRRPQRRPAHRFLSGSPCALLVAAVLTGCALSACRADRGLTPINEDALRAILLDNRGRVVLLNFWASWCAPCVAEFPELVRLARENSAWLAVVSVSIDAEEDVSTKVVPFLRKQAPPFASYIKKTSDDEAFINAIDPRWSGAIPATFIFRPDGTLATRLIGQQSFDNFATAIRAVVSSRQEGSVK